MDFSRRNHCMLAVKHFFLVDRLSLHYSRRPGRLAEIISHDGICPSTFIIDSLRLASSSDSDGFLDIRSFSVSKFWQRVTSSNNATTHSAAPRFLEPCDGILIYQEHDSDMQQEPSMSPLNGRVWIMQERFLSKRTVFFTKYQMFWQCWELRTGENGIVEHRENDSISTPLATTFDSNACWSWIKMIEQYMECNIIKDMDRLPALVGVVAEVAKATGQKCYAGIWEGSGLVGLSWRLMECRPRLFFYRAPSWSWASVEGSIEYLDYGDRFRYCAEMTKIRVEIVGLNPHGEFCGGFLTLLRARIPVARFHCGPVRSHVLIFLNNKQLILVAHFDHENRGLDIEDLCILPLSYSDPMLPYVQLTAIIICRIDGCERSSIQGDGGVVESSVTRSDQASLKRSGVLTTSESFLTSDSTNYGTSEGLYGGKMYRRIGIVHGMFQVLNDAKDFDLLGVSPAETIDFTTFGILIDAREPLKLAEVLDQLPRQTVAII